MAVRLPAVDAIFFCVPKTACSAVAELLIRYHHGEWVPKSDVLDPAGQIIIGQKHSTPSQLSWILKQSPAARVNFCFTRNPFDWLASVYTYAGHVYSVEGESTTLWWVKSRLGFYRDAYGLEFPDFIRKYYSKKGLSVAQKWASGCNYVLKYEDLPSALYRFLEENGIHTVRKLGHENATPGRVHYSNYYDKATKRLVAHNFTSDLRAYGYDFSSFGQ